MSVIRLKLKPELENVLTELRQNELTFLDNAEIVRLALSKYYEDYKDRKMQKFREFEERQAWIDSLPQKQATSSEEKAIALAERELKQGKGIVVDMSSQEQTRKYFGV